jgi:hypothetical protein
VKEVNQLKQQLKTVKSGEKALKNAKNYAEA